MLIDNEFNNIYQLNYILNYYILQIKNVGRSVHLLSLTCHVAMLFWHYSTVDQQEQQHEQL